MTEASQAASPLRLVVKEYFLELFEVFKIGWPLCVTFLCLTGMQFVDLVFIGHLGNSDYLASAALSTALTNCMLFLILGTITAQYVYTKYD
jgi:Na+-driven multidrug efflux pump